MADIRELDTNDSDAYRRLWQQAITEHPSCFRIAPEDEPAPSNKGVRDVLRAFSAEELE